MTNAELAKILRHYYDTAKRNETILSIDLFGIKYGHDIQSASISIKEIVRLSGIGMSYITEVCKAVKLSDYVDIKPKDKDANIIT